ncbi:hypothetical protein M514_26185 [Trichuris suis]|uniref:Uncharacterized protein n=1 Tax=Trichuris suis TaxID=68888 RepID=A0A085MWS0_9BILA|nr:hypothetical protein M514_26185 [Trichuris suis]
MMLPRHLKLPSFRPIATVHGRTSDLLSRILTFLDIDPFEIKTHSVFRPVQHLDALKISTHVNF